MQASTGEIIDVKDLPRSRGEDDFVPISKKDLERVTKMSTADRKTWASKAIKKRQRKAAKKARRNNRGR